MGSAGSFSHTVAGRMHPTWQIVSHRSIEDVGASVARGVVTLGVLPIENSTAGTIQETLDTLLRHRLSIVEEKFLAVSHHLLAKKRCTGRALMKPNAIKAILSHPKAFEQCRTFLASLPNAKLIMVEDTAEAARRVASENDPEVAAIGSIEAARIHGLTVLVRNIHSAPENCTRFIIVQRGRRRAGGTKATICALLPHVPGSLHRLLGAFARHSLNLTHIESRPIADKPWQYRFLIDLDLGTNAARFKKALQQARSVATDIVVLGQYAKGVTL